MKVRLDETLFKARAQENLAMTNEIDKLEQVDALVECLDHFVADRKWVDEVTRDELLTMVTQSHGDKDALVESVLAKFNTPCIDAKKLKECRERRQNKGLKESMKKRKSLKESDNRDTFTLDTSNTPILDCGLYYTLLGELDPGRYDDRFKEFEDCVKECAEPILDELVRKTPNFEVVSVGTYYHPRYYNYETDCLEFTVKYTGDELGTVIEEYSNNQDFIDFLKNYSSYDGFISFYADNKEEFVTQDYIKSVSQIIKYNVTQEDYDRANEELYYDVSDCGFYPEDEYEEDETDESLKEGANISDWDLMRKARDFTQEEVLKALKGVVSTKMYNDIKNDYKIAKLRHLTKSEQEKVAKKLEKKNIKESLKEASKQDNKFAYRIYMRDRDKDFASGKDYKDAKSMLQDAKKDFELANNELRTNPKYLICMLFDFVDGEYYHYKDLYSAKEIEDEIKLEATPSKKECKSPKRESKQLKEEYTPSPMSATDFFDSFDFTIYKSTDEDGDPCYKLRDNQGANLGDIEDDTFQSISDAVNRLDMYYEDYIINDLSEIAPELSGLHSGNYEDVFNKIKDMDKTADGHSVRGHKALLYYILHPEQLKDDVKNLTESKKVKEDLDLTKFYLDVDGEKQKYYDWGVEFVSNYKNNNIVKVEDEDKYTIWSKWNRPLSKITSPTNQYVPIYFDSEEEVKQYIDKKESCQPKKKGKKLKEGYYGQTLQDFLDDCMDYSIIDNIYIYGNNDVVYEGPIDDIPEDMLDTEFLECDMYTDKKSVVTVNVDSSEEYGAGMYEFLNEFLDDCNCELVVIYDLDEGEEIFNGYKEDIPEEYLEYAFVSYDAPEEMSVNLNDYEGEDDFDESLKEDNKALDKGKMITNSKGVSYYQKGNKYYSNTGWSEKEITKDDFDKNVEQAFKEVDESLDDTQKLIDTAKKFAKENDKDVRVTGLANSNECAISTFPEDFNEMVKLFNTKFDVYDEDSDLERFKIKAKSTTGNLKEAKDTKDTLYLVRTKSGVFEVRAKNDAQALKQARLMQDEPVERVVNTTTNKVVFNLEDDSNENLKETKVNEAISADGLKTLLQDYKDGKFELDSLYIDSDGYVATDYMYYDIEDDEPLKESLEDDMEKQSQVVSAYKDGGKYILKLKWQPTRKKAHSDYVDLSQALKKKFGDVDIKCQKQEWRDNNKETRYILEVELKDKEIKEDISPLAKKMGAKFLPPKDYGVKKTKPRYVYEVYYYDTEDCTGDPIFRKFSSRKAQEEWYEKHKDDPDKFDMYAYPYGSIYESLDENKNYNTLLQKGYDALDNANISKYNVDKDTFEFSDEKDATQGYKQLKNVFGKDKVMRVDTFRIKVELDEGCGRKKTSKRAK